MMRRFLLACLILYAIPAYADQERLISRLLAQGANFGTTARAILPVASAPATCIAKNGDVYINTASAHVFFCSADNTWTQVDGGAGAVSSVFGRTGAVVSATNDYAFSQLSGTATDAQLAGVISTLTTYFVAPTGTTTCVFQGDGGTACTPSDSNTGLTKALPFATPGKAANVLRGVRLFGAIARVVFSDTALSTPNTLCHSPANVLWYTPTFEAEQTNALEGNAGGGLTETFPVSYLDLVGNTPTPANTLFSGSGTCAGTTVGQQSAFRFDRTTYRIHGMKFQGYGDTIASTRFFASGPIQAHRSNGFHEDITIIGDATTAGTTGVNGWDFSLMKFGGNWVVTNAGWFQMNGNSLGWTTDPQNSNTVSTNLTYTMNIASPSVFGVTSFDGSLVKIDRLIASWLGTGTYIAWQAQINSVIRFSEGYATTQCQGAVCIQQTVNAANLTFFEAIWGSYIEPPQATTVTTAPLRWFHAGVASTVRPQSGVLQAATNPDQQDGGGCIVKITVTFDDTVDCRWGRQGVTDMAQLQSNVISNVTNPVFSLGDSTLTNYTNLGTAGNGGAYVVKGLTPFQAYASVGGAQLNAFLTQYSSTSTTDAPGWLFRRARGTIASPVALSSGDFIGYTNFLGQTDTTPGDLFAGAGITALADGAWSTASTPGRLEFQLHGASAQGGMGSRFVMDFNAFRPFAAGVGDVGSTATPWGNFWLGTAATNNFKVQPAATAAARTINLWDFGANGPSTQNYPGLTILTSQYTNSTTTFSNVAGGNTLQFPVLASTTYTATCHLYYQAAATGGLNIEFTGPASPTTVIYGLNDPISATAFGGDGVATAYSTSLGSVVTTAATNFDATVSFSLINGVNAGTVNLLAKSSAAVQLQIQAGSFCRVQ